MNKKFFAALASATMAFTASGSIAVFADDFVEEKTPVVDGELKPIPATVEWNKENFGDLVTLKGDKLKVEGKTDLTAADGKTPLAEGVTVKTDDLAKVLTINFEDTDFKGEIKGLEYFTGLTSFSDSRAKEITNETLDFSANTKLYGLTVMSAPNLTEITLPEPVEDEDDIKGIDQLTLNNNKLTSLDLSKQVALKNLEIKNSKLGKLDLSALALQFVTVTGNYNLAEVTLNNGKPGDRTKFYHVDLSDNSLETINLDYCIFETLNLSKNHIGALDLSKTTVNGASETNPNLKDQTFYVSEKVGKVNLKEMFADFDVEQVVDAKDFDTETGVLTLENDGTTEYKYKTTKGKLVVTLKAANPMNRLYNPNSGEHFYTANIKEKEALVKLGWNDEGYGWVAPTEEDGKANPVFRLYNPNAGDHHYTMDGNEVKTLVAYGWKDEGTGWYSATAQGKDASTGTDLVDVYRQYNPYANGAGSHNYTTDQAENDYLVSLGWTPEGKAWTAYK